MISCFGFLKFSSQDDIWDIYAPLNAKSRYEEKALEKFEYASAAHLYRVRQGYLRENSVDFGPEWLKLLGIVCLVPLSTLLWGRGSNVTSPHSVCLNLDPNPCR